MVLVPEDIFNEWTSDEFDHSLEEWERQEEERRRQEEAERQAAAEAEQREYERWLDEIEAERAEIAAQAEAAYEPPPPELWQPEPEPQPQYENIGWTSWQNQAPTPSLYDARSGGTLTQPTQTMPYDWREQQQAWEQYRDQPRPAPAPQWQPEPEPEPILPTRPALNQLQDYAWQTATRHGLEPDVFLRQIGQESGWSQDVITGQRRSSAGATGIGQFIPATATAVANQMNRAGYQTDANRIMTDPQHGLDAAAFHMRDLLTQYGGDYRLALTAYNGGPRAVNALRAGHPFGETQTYLNRIMPSGQPAGGRDAIPLRDARDILTPAFPDDGREASPLLPGLPGGPARPDLPPSYPIPSGPFDLMSAPVEEGNYVTFGGMRYPVMAQAGDDWATDINFGAQGIAEPEPEPFIGPPMPEGFEPVAQPQQWPEVLGPPAPPPPEQWPEVLGPQVPEDFVFPEPAPQQEIQERGNIPAVNAPGTVGNPDLVPNQFTDRALSASEAAAACGPAAAVAFARAMGRNPTLREALDLAKQVNWTPGGGMNGIANQGRLLDRMGIPNRVVVTGERPDEAPIIRDIQGGNPVTISSAGHYFVADAYRDGRYHVGTSGTVVSRYGGSDWMTIAQMNEASRRLAGGGINGVLYLDNPASPVPSVATLEGNTSENREIGASDAQVRALQGLNLPARETPAPQVPEEDLAYYEQFFATPEEVEAALAPQPQTWQERAAEVATLFGQGSGAVADAAAASIARNAPTDTGQALPTYIDEQRLGTPQDVATRLNEARSTVQNQLPFGERTAEIPSIPLPGGGSWTPGLFQAAGIMAQLGTEAVSASAEGVRNLFGNQMRNDPYLNRVAEEQGVDAAFNAWWSTYGQELPQAVKGLIEQGPLLAVSLLGPGAASSTRPAVQAVGRGLEAVDILTSGPLAPVAALGYIPAGRAARAAETSVAPRADPLAAEIEAILQQAAPPLQLPAGAPRGLLDPEEQAIARQFNDYAREITPVLGDNGRQALAEAYQQWRAGDQAGANDAVARLLSAARPAGETPDVIPLGGRPDLPLLNAPSNLDRFPVPPGETRAYHGTAAAFETPDASRFNYDDLYGAGYYVTDSPVVAGGVPGATRPGRGYAWAAARRPGAEDASPNVRAVNLPDTLNLLDAEAPVPPALVDQVLERVGFSAAGDVEDYLGGTDVPTGHDLWRALATAFRDKDAPNEVLAEMGFDGIRYDGGRRVPMRDAGGEPIQHTATMIFQESLPKITNAFSGREGGQAAAPFATELGSAALGAGASQIGTDENTTLQERLARAALGAAGGYGAARAIGRAGRQFEDIATALTDEPGFASLPFGRTRNTPPPPGASPDLAELYDIYASKPTPGRLTRAIEWIRDPRHNMDPRDAFPYIRDIERDVLETVGPTGPRPHSLATQLPALVHETDVILRTELNPIFDRLEAAGGKLSDLDSYMGAKQTIELDTRGFATPRGKTAAWAAQQLQELEQKIGPQAFRALEQAERDVQDFQFRTNLEPSRGSFLTNTQIQDILNSNQHYFPHEVLDFTAREGGNFATGSRSINMAEQEFKRRVGSERDIAAPLDAILARTYRVRYAQGRQDAADALIESLLQHQARGGTRWSITRAQPGKRPPGGYETVSRFKDGEKETYFVPEFLAAEAKQLDASQIGAIGDFFNLINTPSKIAMTQASPDFVLRNFGRDAFDAFYREGLFPLGPHHMRGIYTAIAQDDNYTTWARSHSGMGGLFDSGRGQAPKTLVELRRGRAETMARMILPNPLEFIKRVNQVIEEGPSIGVYMAQSGGWKGPHLPGPLQGLIGEPVVDPMTAAARTREARVDFLNAHHLIKAFNPVAIFLNANVKGTFNALEPIVGRRGPRQQRAAARLAILSGAAVSAWAYNHSRPELADAYEKIPQYDREANIILVNPFTPLVQDERGREIPSYIGIPKPSAGRILWNIADDVMRYVQQNNPRRYDEIAKSFLGSVTPWSSGTDIATIPLPPIAQGMLEAQMNYDTFRMAPIETEGMEGQPVQERARPSTSETAKWVAQRLVDNPAAGITSRPQWSPAKLEHIVGAGFGGTGRAALRGIDELGRGLGVFPQPQGPETDLALRLARFPGTRGIVRAGSNEETKQFEQLAERMRQVDVEVMEQLRGDRRYLQASPEEQARMQRSARARREKEIRADLGITAPRASDQPWRWVNKQTGEVVQNLRLEQQLTRYFDMVETDKPITPEQRQLLLQYGPTPDYQRWYDARANTREEWGDEQRIQRERMEQIRRLQGVGR
jgi:hypothetical protein